MELFNNDNMTINKSNRVNIPQQPRNTFCEGLHECFSDHCSRNGCEEKRLNELSFGPPDNSKEVALVIKIMIWGFRLFLLFILITLLFLI